LEVKTDHLFGNEEINEKYGAINPQKIPLR